MALNRPLFLSTLSLRRATTLANKAPFEKFISIHALLAESDPSAHSIASFSLVFLSTLSLRRATVGGDSVHQPKIISIHALLAESDGGINGNIAAADHHFYPRSPCGERQAQESKVAEALIFLSTLSLRRATAGCALPVDRPLVFLSTLSLRRAT